MKILELSLRNYRQFEQVDLELPARVIGIFGPNGGGKSTLVEAIEFALYGKARTAKQDIRTQGLLTDCVVDLAFEHGGRHYRVTRTIRGRNHTVDAELFGGDLQLATGVTDVDAEVRKLLRMDHQVFKASVFAEQKQLDAFSDVTKGERKKMVLRLLGIRPIETALVASRKESRERKADAERIATMLPDPAELERQLAEAKTAEKASGAAAKEAATALKDAEKRARTAEKAFQTIDRVREQAERIGVERETLAERATELEERVRELTDRLEELRADLEELPALEKEAGALGDVVDVLEAAKRLAEARAETERLEAQLAAIPSVDAEAVLRELQSAEMARAEANDAAVRARAARERAEAETEAARETVERAGELDPSAPCPTCGQELGGGFDSYVAHCRAEVKRLEKELSGAATASKRAQGAKQSAEAAYDRARKRGEAVRAAEERRRAFAERLEECSARLAVMVEPFGGESPDVEALEAGALRAKRLARRIAELETERKQLTRIGTDLEKATAAVAKTATRIEDLDTKAAALAFDPEDHQSARKERDEAVRILEDAREHERSVQHDLSTATALMSNLEGRLEQAREQAERLGDLREDARYLERVSLLLDGFRDHLVSRIGPELSREAEALFRDLTNHEYEDLRIDDDTLTIHIADDGQYFPVERFSGSEADLANLALRVAISMHLSRVSAADVGMMVLDEVLASLDAERKDLLVQTMGKLASRFHQLFVITHAEQVKDQFPASIEVRKTGRRRSEAVLV
jgi:DNA repair protein SbcC/Rad50